LKYLYKTKKWWQTVEEWKHPGAKDAKVAMYDS
jgi:hypothetical protein